MFSAKLTVTLYILVFFELGVVLLISPWYTYWSDNLFLTYLVQRFDAPGLLVVMNSGLIRWTVTGLGAVNILLGIWEAFHFHQLVHLILHDHEQSSEGAVALSDHRSKSM